MGNKRVFSSVFVLRRRYIQNKGICLNRMTIITKKCNLVGILWEKGKAILIVS